MRLLAEVPLLPYTTFQIGGAADLLVPITSLDELNEAREHALSGGLPVFVLGGGSNILASDEGFRGLVLKIEIDGIEQREAEGRICVRAGAGVPWDDFVAWTVERGLSGLENLSGIPGSVGGAVVQNVGAYGAAVSETLSSVEIFDLRTGEVREVSAVECAFGYRDSLFKHDRELVVLAAVFALSKGARPNLSYRDLKLRFEGVEPALPEVREAVLAIRRGKFPDLNEEGTAGSFFKNPILPKAEALVLQERYPAMPLFDMPETEGIKVPVGWILDKALGMRGYAVGNARLFEKQALVIAARRGARATDVRALAEEVIRRVESECGIVLEREVVFLE